MTPQEFIRKWSASELKERSGSQEHFIDLCRMLGEPTPNEADPTGSHYAFEKAVKKSSGGDGFADRGHSTICWSSTLDARPHLYRNPSRPRSLG